MLQYNDYYEKYKRKPLCRNIISFWGCIQKKTKKNYNCSTIVVSQTVCPTNVLCLADGTQTYHLPPISICCSLFFSLIFSCCCWFFGVYDIESGPCGVKFPFSLVPGSSAGAFPKLSFPAKIQYDTHINCLKFHEKNMSVMLLLYFIFFFFLVMTFFYIRETTNF